MPPMTRWCASVLLAILVADARADPPHACRPASTRTTYAVCVVDEAGRPVAGAEVHALREWIGEGFGDVGSGDDDLGRQTTDASGRAVFAVPPIRSSPLVAMREMRRTAFASGHGWPAQEIEGDGRIVLGPLRTVTLRTALHACDGAQTMRLESAGTTDVALPELTVKSDGSAVVEVGPGPYQVRAWLCADHHDASRSASFLGRDKRDLMIR